jgi:hypothetical protein
MMVQRQDERDFLRALLATPQFGLPDYAADPIVQRRVGRVLASILTPVGPRRGDEPLIFPTR